MPLMLILMIYILRDYICHCACHERLEGLSLSDKTFTLDVGVLLEETVFTIFKHETETMEHTFKLDAYTKRLHYNNGNFYVLLLE